MCHDLIRDLHVLSCNILYLKIMFMDALRISPPQAAFICLGEGGGGGYDLTTSSFSLGMWTSEIFNMYKHNFRMR